MTRFLAACRYLLVVPIIGCVLLTAWIVFMGMARILVAGAEVVREGDFSAEAAKMMSLAVIEIIDFFLVGTVAYITAVGLYKLFISNAEIELPVRLKIQSLKDLEDKIIGVVVAAPSGRIFWPSCRPVRNVSATQLRWRIALVIAALAFFTRQSDK